jgi:hypothetical protein
MSLDDIKLSPFLVKKMYEKTLVVSSFANDVKAQIVKNIESEKGIPPYANEKDSIKYLGKNNRHILIVVNEKDHKFLGDDDLSFLLNILSACKLTMADAVLVNSYDNDNIVYEKLIKTFTPSFILFIGAEPQALGFPVQIPMYQVQGYNKQKYLCAPSLQKLSADKEEKKQLWVALQKIFSI